MRIGVTGASGYVGGLVVEEVVRRGFEPVAVGRRPVAGLEHRRFDLERPEPPDLTGLDTVVHAAYDFEARGRDAWRHNLDGARVLLAACRRTGTAPVLVSTLSAYDGARSTYGRVKRALEREFAAAQGSAVRAGVVFGPRAGGIFGSLQASVQSARVVPLVGGGGLPLWVTHAPGLARALVDAPESGAALSLACHPDPVTVAQLVHHLADALGREPRLVTVPWPPVYAALRAAELARLPAPFRSDSVLSLVRPVPPDQFSRLPFAAGDFPPLSHELWLEAPVPAAGTAPSAQDLRPI